MSGPVSEYGENGFSHLQAARVTGWRLTLRQFMAIFLKRFHHVRRSKKGFLVEVRKTSKGIIEPWRVISNNVAFDKCRLRRACAASC